MGHDERVLVLDENWGVARIEEDLPLDKLSLARWSGVVAAVAETEPSEWTRQLLDAKSALAEASYVGNLDQLRRKVAELGRLAKDNAAGWLADYYAGYGSFVLALMVGPGGLISARGDSQLMDQLVDEAIRFLEASVGAKSDFADALALLAHGYSMKLSSDPGQHAAGLGPLAQQKRAAALALDPLNPRAVLIDAMSLFWGPPQWGGDREKGLARWREALALFAQESARDPLLPDWGHAEAWAWLAGAYLVLEPPDPIRAREAAEKALTLHPEFLWIQKSLLPRIEAQLDAA